LRDKAFKENMQRLAGQVDGKPARGRMAVMVRQPARLATIVVTPATPEKLLRKSGQTLFLM